MPKYGGQNRIDFGVHFNTDKSSLTEVQKAFQKLQDIKPANFKGSVEELREIKLQALKVQAALTKAFNVKLGSLNVDKFKKELNGLNIDKIYTDLTKLGSQGQVAFSKMATSMMTTNLQLKETHSLINSMGTTMMNTVKWGIASSVMNNFTQSVSQAFQYVKSLDSALTDIRIVTGDSTEEMAKFADQANKAAQQLGRSTMDYSKAALTFYQQGLSDEDVAARTQATLKAQNITGAGQEMADYLTAVWNGYKVANEEAELYVDKLAAVADSSASNMSQLAIAMSKVASTANMLGVPVDSLNAQIATIVATTRQAPESVGNALKTIYARINDITTGSQDAEVSLGNYTEQMAKLGINVLDSNGKLRDTGDVIEQIGGKWEGLSREQQIYLARTMAGQRQYNNLLALFENWGRYTDLVNVSMESQGTTMEKNSRYMDSLAAHMEQLGAAGERVKSAMIDSDSFKGLIDIGTALTNLFANLIESIGGGGTAFLALGSIVTRVFDGIISKEITNVINNFKLMKENSQALANDIKITEEFGKSQGYSDDIIKVMVEAKKEGQEYYNIMSEGQINAYNGIIKQIGAANDEIIALKKDTDAANELNGAFEKAFGKNSNLQLNILQEDLKELEGATKDLFNNLNKGSLTTDIFNAFEKQIQSFSSNLGSFQIPGLEDLINKIKEIDPSTEEGKVAIQQLRTEIIQLINQSGRELGLINKVDDLNNQTQRAKASLEQATVAKDAFLDPIKAQANVKQIVDTISAVGRLTSGFMALANITKIIGNDSLSMGEKVLQVISQVGFSIPMILSSLGAINKGLKLTSTLNILLAGSSAKAAGARLTQLLTEEQLAKVKAVTNSERLSELGIMDAVVLKEILLTAGIEGETAAKIASTVAQHGLNAAMAANPIGMWLIGIAAATAALIGIVKIVDHFTMSTKEAEQAINNFNQKQKEFNSSTKQYAEQTASLRQMRNQYEALAQKAGAATGDSRIDNLTQAERQRYNELKNTIAEYNDEVISGYNAKGQVILKNNQALDDTIEKLEKIHQLETDEFYQGEEWADYTKAKQKQYKDAQSKVSNLEIIGTNSYSIQEQGSFQQAKREIKKEANRVIDTEGNSIISQQQKQLDKILNDGVKNLYQHIDELKNIKQEIENISPKTANNINPYIDTLIELANVPNDKQVKIDQAKRDLEEAAKFDANDIIGRLGASDKNAQYKVLAEQYGQENINSIISGYVSGLSRADFSDENEVADNIRSILLQPLLDTNITSEDFSHIQEQIATAMNSEDITSMTQQNYNDFIQKTINSIYQGNNKLKELAETDQGKEIVKNLLKGWFGLEDIEFDSQGNLNKIVDNYTKTISEARTKFKTALEDEQIELDTREKASINYWINEQDIGTLSNFNDILEKVKQNGEWTAEAFQKAKNEVNNMAISDALSGASSLLQRKAKGENLSDEEQVQLSNYLSQLRTLIPQYKETVETLQKDWLSGTRFYQSQMEEIVNATFDIIRQGKEARIAQEEQQAKNGEIGYQQINRGPTEQESFDAASLIANTENLQTAQEKGLLLSNDYQDSLQKLASQYQTCNTELSHYAQALASGNEQLANNAASSLLLSVRSAELAERSGLSADQIQRTATWLAKDSEALQQNSQLAADAAQRYLRLNNAVDDLYNNQDKYIQLMKQMATSGEDAIYANEELYNTFDQFKTQAADVLDTEKEFLSDNWIADHMQNIMDAALKGGEGLEELRASAAEDILVNMGIKIDEEQFGLSTEQFMSRLGELEDGADLNVDANLDLIAWTQQLVTAMQQAGYAQTEIEAALSGMGIDVDLAPYNAQLQSAAKNAANAGKLASDYFANNAGVNVKTKTQSKTEQYENSSPNLDYDVVPLTGTYTYPIIEQGILGPSVSSTPGEMKITYPAFRPKQSQTIQEGQSTSVATALEVIGATKSSGGKISNYNMPAQRNARKARTGSGGSKGGGKGSSSKPSQAKKNTTKIETKKKTTEKDPYYKNTLALEKQSNVLKKIQDQQKGLVNKDRLKNLQDQNDTLKEQNKLLRQRQAISNNKAEENSTANLRAQLEKRFKNIKFDADGNIADLNKIEKAAVNSYNKAATAANNTFKKAQNDYNKWIEGTWNKHSKEWQDNHQHEKETWDQRIKDAEENAKKAISTAEEEYKKKEDLIKNYQKALQEDQKAYEEYMDNIRQIMQNTFEASKITVDLSLDAGQLERQWQQFENKFIRKIDDDDILGNAAANAREMMSYFNSEELSKTSNQITKLYKDLNDIEEGNWSNILTSDLAEDTSWKKLLKEGDQESIRQYGKSWLQDRLNELVKQQQESLMAMQDLIDDIKEQYLDMIDQAHDKMEEHIDQYDRVNSIIEHNVKLTELLYGDKGYDTLNKYYELQKSNNMATLESLKEQRDLWKEQMDREMVGSDSWKKFKENYEDKMDAVYSKMEDMIDLLTTQFDNKLAAAVDRINNKLTGGLGTDYLDEQWDYLNNYDDYFLDTYNATTGVEDVTRAYQQAIDDAAANPKQQQRLNTLMKDQLKILKEKDKLTEYDLDRAKSMLEVEKARMALEDARNNKTKMRLRRDSQGNYTYQYVADEEKLSDLQQALADAQNDLYNTDKQHYKENLNQLYDTYKEYMEKMKDLTAEYNATQDEEERARIQKRIDLLNASYEQMYAGLTEDNKYNIQYLTQSFADGMHIDMSGLSSEEQWQVLKNNIPWAKSNIQNLTDSIIAQGGLIPATQSAIEEFGKAVKETDEAIDQILNTGGTSVDKITQVVDQNGKAVDENITNEQAFLMKNQQLIDACKNDIDKMRELLVGVSSYWEENTENLNNYITALREGYNTLQGLNNSSLTVDSSLPVVQDQLNALTGGSSWTFTGNIINDAATLRTNLNELLDRYNQYIQEMISNAAQYDTGGYTGDFTDGEAKLAFLHGKELVLNPVDTENILAAVAMVRDITARMNVQTQLNNLSASTGQLLNNLAENSTLLDQQVHIDANFPNVTQHTQIEEAFNNLVNMAAMRASEYRD